MKKISVIVPVYKVEAVLKKCLDSIITQTYENLEIMTDLQTVREKFVMSIPKGIPE